MEHRGSKGNSTNKWRLNEPSKQQQPPGKDSSMKGKHRWSKTAIVVGQS
jgi:hypothetical protein